MGGVIQQWTDVVGTAEGECVENRRDTCYLALLSCLGSSLNSIKWPCFTDSVFKAIAFCFLENIHPSPFLI